MKKIFVCFAILTFLFCGSAYATPANIKLNPPVYEGSNIVIKGELASKNKETVSLISYKKGGKANNPNDVVSVIERPSNDDGKFSFTFTMQDEKGASINGDYVVRVMAKDNARSEVEFSYLCEDTRNEVLNTLDKISSKTQFSEFINNSLYENIFIVAGVDFGKYKGMSSQNQTKVLDMFYENCNFKTIKEKEFVFRMNYAIGIIMYNSETTIEKCNDILKNINPKFDDKIDYNTILASGEQKLISELNQKMFSEKPYLSIETFSKRFIDSYGLYNINNSKPANIQANLEKYKVNLAYINLSEYVTYINAPDKTLVNDKIIISLKSKAANSVSELMAVLKKATDNASDKPTHGGGNGGGGGGGGHYENVNQPKPEEPLPDPNIIKFNDISDVGWAKESIEKLTGLGVISGYDDKTFKPNNYITREEFTKMVVVAGGYDISEGKCDFVDVDLKGWSTKYIVTAKQKGIINGISETQFAPNENILRQDMAVIVARCAKLLNKTIVENGSVTISDMDEVDEYAKESVEYLVRMGILSGDEVGNFKPKDSLTRAECAKVVYSLIDTDK